MTSTPVKEVGSLMNYVGNRVAQTKGMGTGSTDCFGDVMSKASGNGQHLANDRKVDSAKEAARKETRVDKSSVRKETPKANEKRGEIENTETVEGRETAVNEAADKVVKKVAEELGVSEEEVAKAMEELGFGALDLLNAENLTKLVLALSGESNPLALLTNEGLYATVQDLAQYLDEVKKELAMSEEELQQLMARMDALNEMPKDGQGMSETDSSEMIAEEENAKITVTVEQGAETVKLSADENGNVIQVKDVTSKNTDSMFENSAKEQSESSGRDGNEQGLQTGNPLIDQLLQNRVQSQEAVYSQSAAYMTPDTDEIMNQIMDYMKIQLKPGMEQLEMQLHPESLGTLHIQITSKGGELTAQFHVQNEAVKAAIESQLVELKDNFKEQGIKVEAVEVTVESHAFESNLWQGRGRDDAASYEEKRKAPRRINLNELEEGLELEEEEEQLAAKMMEVNGNTVDYMA